MIHIILGLNIIYIYIYILSFVLFLKIENTLFSYTHKNIGGHAPRAHPRERLHHKALPVFYEHVTLQLSI